MTHSLPDGRRASFFHHHTTWLSALEVKLRGCFDSDRTHPQLKAACDYSLIAPGKRLRPLCVVAACDALGGDVSHAWAPAMAIEMIHTFSLIHDDLPAMDDDDMRRGRPSNHKVFGEAVAILAGDALLGDAFRVLIEEGKSTLKPQALLDCLYQISVATGAYGMMSGQTFDVLGFDADERALQKVHALKTGALIRAAIRCGAIVGLSRPHPAGPNQRLTHEALDVYADSCGLAYQIVDDVLDATQNSATLGKPSRSDLKNAKYTFVDALGVTGAQVYAQSLLGQALAAIAPLGERGWGLEVLARQMIERSA